MNTYTLLFDSFVDSFYWIYAALTAAQHISPSEQEHALGNFFQKGYNVLDCFCLWYRICNSPLLFVVDAEISEKYGRSSFLFIHIFPEKVIFLIYFIKRNQPLIKCLLRHP